MFIIKDLIITLLLGVGLGELLMRVSLALNIPIPSHPSQRPVFLIGTILFSLVFRLLIALRDEGKKTPKF